MNDIQTHLKVVGVMMILLSLVHIAFPLRFSWKEEFSGVSLLSRQIMYVHTFFVALIVLLNGLLCFVLIENRSGDLAAAIAWGMLVFWGLRCLFQFFVYSSALWKGKKFETLMHVLFSLVWFYFTFISAWLVWSAG